MQQGFIYIFYGAVLIQYFMAWFTSGQIYWHFIYALPLQSLLLLFPRHMLLFRNKTLEYHYARIVYIWHRHEPVLAVEILLYYLVLYEALSVLFTFHLGVGVMNSPNF